MWNSTCWQQSQVDSYSHLNTQLYRILYSVFKRNYLLLKNKKWCPCLTFFSDDQHWLLMWSVEWTDVSPQSNDSRMGFTIRFIVWTTVYCAVFQQKIWKISHFPSKIYMGLEWLFVWSIKTAKKECNVLS